MRIISGECKGLPLKAVPGNSTRPTSDKVKEAIFSRIGPYFTEGTVLDLFAGTGSLGLEALSRGMNNAVFIDKEKKSLEIIHENVKRAKMQERTEIYRNDARRALQALAKRDVSFNLVFLDPPYRLKYIEEILEQLEQGQMLSDDAIIIVEHDASHNYTDELGSIVCERRQKYGDTAVSFYRYHKSIDS